MLIIGLILLPFAIYFALRLLYGLTIFALPVFAGISAGFFADHHGAGVMAAILVALTAGIGIFVAGQIAFRLSSSPAIRALLALIFAAPAIAAGYYATLGVEHLVIASSAFCQPLAVICAAVVGWTSIVKLAGPPGETDWAAAWRKPGPSSAAPSTYPSPVPDGPA